MSYVVPTITQFKEFFFRDFPYGTDPATSVLDGDIVRAIMQSGVGFNEGLWENQATYEVGAMLLSAHYLVMDLRMSSQGLSGKQSWFTTSKGVGSVSESYQIPDRILANPEFAMLAQTPYGARYLMMIMSQLAGAVYCVGGRTHA